MVAGVVLTPPLLARNAVPGKFDLEVWTEIKSERRGEARHHG